jgi:hypothetical protein
MKQCSRCQSLKPIDDFHRDRSRPDGHRSECGECYNSERGKGLRRKVGYKATSGESRFWPRVQKSDGCWLWTGGVMSTGYGFIFAEGRRHLTHRYSWALAHGSIPTLNVLHRCDVRLCVRPDHLFLGTNQDNIDDMLAKGRNRRGSAKSQAKLTESDVVAIRERAAAGELKARLAEEYGVTNRVIGEIVRFQRWKHVLIPCRPYR